MFAHRVFYRSCAHHVLYKRVCSYERRTLWMLICAHACLCRQLPSLASAGCPYAMFMLVYGCLTVQWYAISIQAKSRKRHTYDSDSKSVIQNQISDSLMNRFLFMRTLESIRNVCSRSSTELCKFAVSMVC